MSEQIAEGVNGVLEPTIHVRKLGFDHYVDLDILCSDPDSTIREGHEIAHNVGEVIRHPSSSQYYEGISSC